MTTKQINDIHRKVSNLLDKYRLKEAFALIRQTAEESMAWEYGDRVSQLEESYRYMLQYLMQGVNDPDRDKVYNSLLCGAHATLDALVRHLLTRDSASLYFNTLRYIKVSKTSLRELIANRIRLSESNIIDRIESGDNNAPTDSGERLDRDIFNAIWVSLPLAEGDAELIRETILDETAPRDLAIVMLSATLLGLLEYFDENKIKLLLTVYENSDDMRLSSIALASLLIALFKYRDRELPASVTARLQTLASLPGWKQDLRIAFIEMIRARDTERINRTMQDEILPGMMKIQPEILTDIRDGRINPEDLASIEANPAWEDMLKKNGVADKIKEMSELQQDGSDVFMSTFSHLKSFPFFNDASNWFVPFTTQRAELTSGSHKELTPIAELIESLPFLCDSDKYSFVLSLNMVPQAQRDLMLSQFKMQKEQHFEAMGSMMYQTANEQRRTEINNFLQNIYRFFKLFNRSSEFYDPFNEGLNLLKVDTLREDLDDTETLRVVAEFYFKLGYWNDALDAFVRLDEMSIPEAAIFEKIGYCYQMLQQNDKAIEMYKQAEIFEPDNRWVLNQLAKACRAERNYSDAIGYYNRLLKLYPDNPPASLTLNLGYCHLQVDEPEDAAKMFYNYQFNNPDSTQADRPLAWALFLLGKYDKSLALYEKIIAHQPTSDDYLNAGHVAFALSNLKEAVNYYKLAISTGKKSLDEFFKILGEDKTHLHKAGISDSSIKLVMDALLYSI